MYYQLYSRANIAKPQKRSTKINIPALPGMGFLRLKFDYKISEGHNFCHFLTTELTCQSSSYCANQPFGQLDKQSVSVSN